MSRTLIAVIGLSFLLAACAHGPKKAAPAQPDQMAKAQPAPQAKPAPPAPRQYEGPPPNRPARKIVVPHLRVPGRSGWIMTSSQRFQMTIMHPKTGADLTFIMAPTAQLGPPVMFANQLAAVSKKNGLKVGKVRVSKDGQVAYFLWRQRIVKKGQRTRWKRGIARVAMDKKVPAISVVMLGRWPAKYHRLMRKEFRAYARSLQVSLKTIMVK
jgi:hypothetical protein